MYITFEPFAGSLWGLSGDKNMVIPRESVSPGDHR